MSNASNLKALAVFLAYASCFTLALAQDANSDARKRSKEWFDYCTEAVDDWRRIMGSYSSVDDEQVKRAVSACWGRIVNSFDGSDFSRGLQCGQIVVHEPKNDLEASFGRWICIRAMNKAFPDMQTGGLRRQYREDRKQ